MATGEVLPGTPSYELLERRPPASGMIVGHPQSDVYSLGAVLECC